ncbi:dTDP-4-dehydrorhamnose 3,5-epimerase family protein [bacterium]|nr:dTDP-4-dehydrorhamnose 3,5-epimerase family protein [bacterium]
MGRTGIEGVLLTPLKKISHPKGDILHGIKKNDQGFVAFGEAYFTKVNFGEIKGWNKHKSMTLNLVVPVGKVVFVLYDHREKSKTRGNFLSVEISVDAYQRLTVLPGVWLAFKGKDNGINLILNVADMEYDPDEVERLNLDQIEYNWDAV